MTSVDLFMTDIIPHCSVAEWDRIYRLDAQAMPSQSSTWANAICTAGGYKIQRRKYIFSDGIEAAIPLFARNRRRNPFHIQRSPPAAWGFGGPISTHPLGAAHLRSILGDCADLPGAAIQIRPNPLLADLWADAAANSRWDAVAGHAHVLDLEGGFDEVWTNRFPKSTRNLARKAEKLGITTDSGSSADLVAEFDGLFRLSIARWARKQNEFAWLASFRGHLRDPKRKFLEMARLCSDIMQVTIARQNGQAIAGIVVLYGPNAHYTRGAMDHDAVGNSGANCLLQAAAIKEACERQCQSYHMGESSASGSLATFKAHFGAVGYPYAEYRHERFPILSADRKLRAIAKRAIGFRDV